MSPKYRQPGYLDSAEKSDAQPRQERTRDSREGPRSPRMPGFDRVIRCALCGSRLGLEADEIGYTSQCPKCSADLHSCRNCVYFNPSRRFECEQPVAARVSPKDKRADCEYFQIRSTVEKIITSGTQRPTDAKQAFENLFKR